MTIHDLQLDTLLGLLEERITNHWIPGVVVEGKGYLVQTQDDVDSLLDGNIVV